jgi:hypothetical protein
MKEYDLTKLIELLEFSIKELKAITEPKRWRAEKGGRYWFATEYFNPIETTDENYYCDNARYNSGNYFQTEAECQEFCDKVKNLLR